MGKRYIYELIDSADGVVFYVGKGTGGRISAHESEASRGGNSEKCRKIREIWARGDSVSKRIVSRHPNDIEAYKAEADHMSLIGRENLTNQRDGGLGGRFKFGRDAMVEDATEIISALKKWHDIGSPKSIRIGSHGVLDLASVVAAYRAKLFAMAEKFGFAEIKQIGQAYGIKFAFPDLEIQSAVSR